MNANQHAPTKITSFSLHNIYNIKRYQFFFFVQISSLFSISYYISFHHAWLTFLSFLALLVRNYIEILRRLCILFNVHCLSLVGFVFSISESGFKRHVLFFAFISNHNSFCLFLNPTRFLQLPQKQSYIIKRRIQQPSLKNYKKVFAE